MAQRCNHVAFDAANTGQHVVGEIALARRRLSCEAEMFVFAFAFHLCAPTKIEASQGVRTVNSPPSQPVLCPSPSWDRVQPLTLRVSLDYRSDLTFAASGYVVAVVGDTVAPIRTASIPRNQTRFGILSFPEAGEGSAGSRAHGLEDPAVVFGLPSV